MKQKSLYLMIALVAVAAVIGVAYYGGYLPKLGLPSSQVGVDGGDMWTYHVDYSPSAPAKKYFVSMIWGHTAVLTETVYDSSGHNISSRTVEIDVSLLRTSDIDWVLCRKQAGIGVKLFDDGLGPTEQGKVDHQEMLSFWGAPRLTNVVMWMDTVVPNVYYSWYFDYATGILCEKKVNNAGGGETAHQMLTSVSFVNQLPNAQFTYLAALPKMGQQMVFDGSASTDPDGTIVSYDWKFGDDNSTASGVVVDHTFAVNGTWSVSLTVTDNAGGQNTDVQPLIVAVPEFSTVLLMLVFVLSSVAVLIVKKKTRLGCYQRCPLKFFA